MPNSRAPRISFAISANARAEDLERLKRGLLAQEGAEAIEILAGGQVERALVSHMRNDLYARAKGEVVYFLDADCEIPGPGFILNLLRRLDAEGPFAAGGFYRSAQEEKIWAKAYNSMCGFWLTIHAAAGQPLPLAGNFILPKVEPTGPEFPFRTSSSFGGEEVALAENLKARGIIFKLSPDLTVIHRGGHDSSRFWSRAALHGGSRRQKLRPLLMIAPAVRYLARQELFVGLLVVSYIGTVWISRFWNRLFPIRRLA